jgi:hypothetical protein
MGNVSKALIFKASARVGKGYQQSYPQIIGITLKAITHQALSRISQKNSEQNATNCMLK